MLDSPNASGPTSSQSTSKVGSGSSSSTSASSILASASSINSFKSGRNQSQKQAKAIMEFSKADLLRLLGLLEAELQARDVVINSLKIERAKLLKPPKNHHRQYTLANPYTALVRDTEKGTVVNEAEEEKGKGSDTKDVVASLQAVIEQHKKAEERMKTQLQALKASHTKAVTDLEDEKKKHAQDTAQGDDVTYMLEKERERLMQQVDFEKAQQRKLERECKRAQGRMIQERKKHVEFTKIMLDKHIQLAQQLADAQQRVMEWETQAQAMRAEAQNASKIAAEERNKAVKMEAEMEKKLSEFDIEREQLLGRLHREEVRTKELRTELESVKSAQQKPAPLMNGRVMTGSELNSNTKGSAPRSIPNSADTKTGKNKGTSHSLRNPSALSNPKSSVKLFGAKGYKSPPRSDKSEGSSSGSEDLNITASVKIRSVSPAVPSAKISGSDSRSKDKPSVAASKPKTSTTNFTKGAGSQSRPLSPATSLDRLSGKSTSSSSLSSSHQKGTKIPSSSSMFANSPQTKKSTPTVAVVAPQPSKAVPQESSKQQQSVHKKQSEVTNSAKTEKTESTPKAGHLSRPTALLTNDSGNKSGELSNKAALLRNTLASPKEPSPRDRSPTRSFGGVNVRAAAAQLTSPVGKKVFNPLSVIPPASNPTSSTHSGTSGGATTTTTTATSQATGGSSSTATSNTVKPPVTSPSSTTPGKRNVSPRGSTPGLTRLTLCPSAWESPLHQAARQGNTATLCRLIEEQHDRTSPEKDGSTLVHAAAYGGQLDSLDLLLTLGGDPNTAQAEGLTPLHVAAGEGHDGCVSFLLDHGANCTSRDSQGWQPIHWAAASGHASCVRTLLDKGATRDCITNIGWTPFHASARYGQMNCLHTLLYYTTSTEQTDILTLTQTSQHATHQPVSPDLLNTMDHDGWTLAHVLASTGQKEMLVALHQYGGVHLTVPDRRGRTPYDVATDSCKEFLNSITEGKRIRVILDVSKNATPINDLSPHLLGQKDDSSQFVIGQLSVQSGMTWAAFDQAIGTVLTNHCKIPDSIDELDSPDGDKSPLDDGSEVIDLGIGVNSINSYVAGNLHWSVGETPSMPPHELFNLTSDIVIKLHGNPNGRLDQLAYETFLPLQTLQNYVRLIEQYKSVLFYGAPGSGKSRIAVKLAEFIQAKHKHHRGESDVTYVSLNSTSTHQELCKLLLSKGFLIQSTSTNPNPQHNNKTVHVLVLDGLGKVGVADLFGDLLPLLENRGSQKSVRLVSLSNMATFSLHESCIIIGTVDGVGPGTDLAVQQRFRWIRFDWDREPVRGILPRYLLRRLTHERDGAASSPNDETVRVVYWACGIWKRLNEALAKLSMPELSTGPKQFFACPMDGDTPGSILRWLCLLWNYSLAPHIEDSFHRNTPSPGQIQQQNMAASTALYVLLHRAFLPGCPLSDEETDEYFSSFRGISAPAVELASEKTGSLKRSRRSKSLDRSKTSNKAAALAKNQAHLDLMSTDAQRNGRSMIPRRIIQKPVKQVKQGSHSSSQSINTGIAIPRSHSIPTSPTEESDFLESLLNHHGNQSLPEIERLIEVQQKLFGGGAKNSQADNHHQSPGNNNNNLGSASLSSHRLLRRSSDGAPVSTGLARTKSKDEDGVWSVWEETV